MLDRGLQHDCVCNTHYLGPFNVTRSPTPIYQNCQKKRVESPPIKSALRYMCEAIDSEGMRAVLVKVRQGNLNGFRKSNMEYPLRLIPS